MFSALNIDRNNILNAVSDNMLDDLGLTKGDYVSYALSYSRLAMSFGINGNRISVKLFLELASWLLSSHHS